MGRMVGGRSKEGQDPYLTNDIVFVVFHSLNEQFQQAFNTQTVKDHLDRCLVRAYISQDVQSLFLHTILRIGQEPANV